jgi:copper oxidase (laccase) domain-containing protein
VGPEVHRALGLPAPPEPTPVDLRSVLIERALGMGILWAHLTCSPFCTLCGSSPFFSSRGGATQRQVGFLGISPS